MSAAAFRTARERPPRVLVAPDKFKGTLSAHAAAAAIAAGITDAFPDAIVTTLPFADGGEGTVDAIVAAGAAVHVSRVTGPLGVPVDAKWAMLDDTAVIEMAQASGLRLVEPSPATSLQASSAGTGELIRIAVEAGADRVVVGVGGSASTDAGAGALQALGVRLLNFAGDEIGRGGGALCRLAVIDASSARALLDGVEIVLCADVANSFVGPAGAAHAFAPQKGAGAEAVAVLEHGLRTFATATEEATGRDLLEYPWGGAGGGFAGGLFALLDARIGDSVEIIGGALDLEELMLDADLVVVGEGSLDAQSLMGKAPVAIARRARAHDVPCIAVAGRIDATADALATVGIADAIASSSQAPSISEAMEHPGIWVRRAAASVMQRWATGDTTPAHSVADPVVAFGPGEPPPRG